MDRRSVEQWAERYRAAWEGADSEAAAALFAEHSTYRSEIYAEPHQGRSGVADYWTAVTSTQSDVTVRMGEPLVEGDRAVVEFWTEMAVEGEPMTLAGALLLDFDDSGLCTALREYWHFTTGSFQPPAGWGW
jgi:hypothetical protein